MYIILGKPGVYKQKPYEEPKKKAYVTLVSFKYIYSFFLDNWYTKNNLSRSIINIKFDF